MMMMMMQKEEPSDDAQVKHYIIITIILACIVWVKFNIPLVWSMDIHGESLGQFNQHKCNRQISSLASSGWGDCGWWTALLETLRGGKPSLSMHWRLPWLEHEQVLIVLKWGTWIRWWAADQAAWPVEFWYMHSFTMCPCPEIWHKICVSIRILFALAHAFSSVQ